MIELLLLNQALILGLFSKTLILCLLGFKRDCLALYEKYAPIELDYSLDVDTKSNYMKNWYIEVMNLTYSYGLTYDILKKCVFYGNIIFRDGIKDFLYDLYIKNIPVIILSAGIGNVILETLKLNNCLYDNIYIVSNFIDFKNNLMLPFSSEIIHTCNKSINILSSHISNKIIDKDYILLFGDLIEDLNMINSKDLNKTFSFGFLEKNVDKNFEFYKNSFDVVLTDNSSFYDVKNILENLFNDRL